MLRTRRRLRYITFIVVWTNTMSIHKTRHTPKMCKRNGYKGESQLNIAAGLQSVKQFLMNIVETAVGHHQNKVAGGGMLNKKFNNAFGVGEKVGILAALL